MAQDHYFSRSTEAPSKPKRINARLRGELWMFDTDAGMFSPEHIDPGSRLLMDAMEVPAGSRVLDLGAGYGPLGLVAARLAGPTGSATLLEVNERAAALAVTNAELNLVTNATVLMGDALEAPVLPAGATFDVVLTNPPYSAGKPTVMKLLELGASVLAPGGRFYLVGAKFLGIKSYAKALDELVGPVETMDRGGGYRVLLAYREAERGDG